MTRPAAGHAPPAAADHCYTASPDALSTEVQGQAVLLHMGTRAYFRLNDSASVVWAALATGARRAELLAALCRRFDVAPETAAPELDRLLADLGARGLVRVDAAA